MQFLGVECGHCGTCPAKRSQCQCWQRRELYLGSTPFLGNIRASVPSALRISSLLDSLLELWSAREQRQQARCYPHLPCSYYARLILLAPFSLETGKISQVSGRHARTQSTRCGWSATSKSSAGRGPTFSRTGPPRALVPVLSSLTPAFATSSTCLRGGMA